MARSHPARARASPHRDEVGPRPRITPSGGCRAPLPAGYWNEHGRRERQVSTRPGSSRTTTRPLRPFDRRLLERTAAARWTLLVNVGAGLAGALLLLAQMTLLAAVIAGAAESRLDQVPAALLAAVVAIAAARAGLVQVIVLACAQGRTNTEVARRLG